MPKVLYTSGQVYAAIQKLFSGAKGRRVAVAAFVGADAADFLPNADGLEVYCWPKLGSTSAEGIDRLRRRGAVVRLVGRLHSKVYWAQGRGCVIASSNLSRSAMGSKSLIESGVLLPDGAVDIDKLLRPLKPRDVAPADLRRLRAAEHARARQGQTQKTPMSFRDWRRSGSTTWKWSWFQDYWTESDAKDALAWAKATYGVPEPYDSHYCGKGKVRPHDWLLVVRLGRNESVGRVRWMYANNVVTVHPKEKRIYDRRWPRQAVQAQSLKSCPTPPFEIDRRFVAAFKQAAKEWGRTRLRAQVNEKRPTEPFLEAIERHWR